MVYLFVFLTAIGFVFSAWAQPSGGNEVTVGEADNGKQITLNHGATLVVQLPSNTGSTGYSWSIAQNNTSLLEPVGHHTEPAQGGNLGARGLDIFRFRAIAPGGEALAFLLQSPNAKGVEAAKKFRILVTINRGAEDKIITVTEEDNGRVVNMLVGDTLVVRLPAQPSTGYTWTIAHNDDSILRKEDSSDRTEGLFRFHAIGTGGFQLRLINHQTFNKGQKPAKAFEIQVAVKPRGEHPVGS